eukprot:8544362-Pyramimonas_sp.AAC.2
MGARVAYVAAAAAAAAAAVAEMLAAKAATREARYAACAAKKGGKLKPRVILLRRTDIPRTSRMPQSALTLRWLTIMCV